MASYSIEIAGNITSLRLTEFGQDRAHDFQTANATNHSQGTDVAVQWVIEGSVGASLGLSFTNNRGSLQIVKQSKITSANGIHQSGAVFRAP